VRATGEPEGLDMNPEEEDTLDKMIARNPDYYAFLKFVLRKLRRLVLRR
jgi:hypothetical protein